MHQHADPSVRMAWTEGGRRHEQTAFELACESGAYGIVGTILDYCNQADCGQLHTLANMPNPPPRNKQFWTYYDLTDTFGDVVHRQVVDHWLILCQYCVIDGEDDKCHNDTHGTILHFATKYFCVNKVGEETMLKIVQMILKKNPGAAKIPDKNNRLPGHELEGKGIGGEILQLL